MLLYLFLALVFFLLVYLFEVIGRFYRQLQSYKEAQEPKEGASSLCCQE